MASNNDKQLKFLRILTICVSFSIVAQILVSLFAFSRVKAAKQNFQVTSENFTQAVSKSVYDFLSTLKDEDITTNSAPSALFQITQEFLSGCVWQSYRHGYLLRVNGVDFSVGDYFRDGLIVGIHPGRVYVRASDGSITVFRPCPPADGETRSARLAAADDGAEESAL